MQEMVQDFRQPKSLHLVEGNIDLFEGLWAFDGQPGLERLPKLTNIMHPDYSRPLSHCKKAGGYGGRSSALGFFFSGDPPQGPFAGCTHQDWTAKFRQSG